VPSGQIIYAAARDITNRKRNETLLAAQKSLAEKLATVEDMPQALSICLDTPCLFGGRFRRDLCGE
jgi:transcriptional antiterminator Rof (Rho-off)